MADGLYKEDTRDVTFSSPQRKEYALQPRILSGHGGNLTNFSILNSQFSSERAAEMRLRAVRNLFQHRATHGNSRSLG